MGVMGSSTVRHPRRIYASRDAVSLDIVAGRHVGAEVGKLSVVDMCKDWFGDPRAQLVVDGIDEPIQGWIRPDHSTRTAMLQNLAMPFYAHTSARGELFLPNFDEEAFPPLAPTGFATDLARKLVRAVVRDENRFQGLLPVQWLDTPEGRVRMSRAGAGPPLVLLHG